MTVVPGSWFPVYEEQFLDDGFQQLTATEKIFYWYLASEFNEFMGKRFYRSDVHFAAALGLSEIKIRKARKKFERLGFIKVTSGTRTRTTNLATTYHAVKWAIPSDYAPPDKGELIAKYMALRRVPGLPFSPMHRHAFNVLLAEVRHGRLTHKDLVVFMVLRHWWHSKQVRMETEDGKIKLSKRVLIKDSGELGAVTCIKNLYEKFVFSGGEHLFEYVDGHQNLVFSKYAAVADPANNEISFGLSQRFKKDIDAAAEALRKAAKQAKAAGAEKPAPAP